VQSLVGDQGDRKGGKGQPRCVSPSRFYQVFEARGLWRS